MMIFGGHTVAAEAIMEVIPLHYRSGNEIQALIEPLLAEGDSIIANQDSVIIKTLPTRLQNIQQTVSKLDTPIQNLLISVMTTHQDQASAAILDSPSSNHGMSGIQSSTQGIDDRKNLQQIRTLDGHVSRIEISQSRFQENVSVFETVDGYRGFSTNSTRQPHGQGFSVIAHLQGDNEVLIQIEPWSERENQNNIDGHYAKTSSRIRLGEWVDLFGGRKTPRQEFAGMNHDLHTSGMHLFIKVEKTNP